MFLVPRFRVAAKPEPTKSSTADAPKAQLKNSDGEVEELPLPFMKKRRKREDPASKSTSAKGDAQENVPDGSEEPVAKKKQKSKANEEAKGKHEVGKKLEAGAEGEGEQPKKKKKDKGTKTSESTGQAKKESAKGKAKAKAEAPSKKARENLHAKRRAKKRKKRKQAAKQVERLMEAKRYEKRLPEISALYLQAWAAKQDGVEASEAGEWHFNRQTQRWLLQNAYESDKVSKETFALLLRYLDGLRGSGRDQLEVDATAMLEREGAPAPVVAEEQPMGKKKRKQKEAEEAAARERGEELVAPEPAEPDEEELKRRKMRIKRAKKLLAALEASAHLVEAEAAAKAAAKAADT